MNQEPFVPQGDNPVVQDIQERTLFQRAITPLTAAVLSASALALSGCNAQAAAEGAPVTVTVVAPNPSESTPTTTPQPTETETVPVLPAVYQKNQLPPSDNMLFPGNMFSGDNADPFNGTNNMRNGLKLNLGTYSGDAIIFGFGPQATSRLNYVANAPRANANPATAQAIFDTAKDLFPADREEDGQLMTFLGKMFTETANGQNREKIWFLTNDATAKYIEVGGSPEEEITQDLFVARGGNASAEGAVPFARFSVKWLRNGSDSSGQPRWEITQSKETPLPK